MAGMVSSSGHRARGQGWREDLEGDTRDPPSPRPPPTSAGKKCNFSTVLRTDNLEEMPLEFTSENQKEEARGRDFLVEGTEGAKVWRGRREPYPKATG